LQNIQDQYNHYKIMADTGYQIEEIECMNLYFDRLKKVREANKEVQTKHIKKGLAAVLR